VSERSGFQSKPIFGGASFATGMGVLQGLCSGVLADGVLVQEEVEYLSAWLEQHPELTAEWPASVLIERIGRVMADGKMDADEEGDLVKLLLQFIAGSLHDEASPTQSSAIPLDDPPPPVVFSGRTFCLTGKFACGSRREIENTIKDLGGKPMSYVRGDLNYLVVGTFASKGWSGGNYGRKIEDSVAARSAGYPVAIVGEDWFYQAVMDALPTEGSNAAS
jgi:hypothetical protein